MSIETALAAHWAAGSLSANRGSIVTIPITLAGDGVSTDAELTISFDESRLTLLAGNGVIPKAGANGATCLRSTANQIRIVSPSFGTAPLPGTPTLYCNLPFAVNANAPAGTARFQSIRAECRSPTATQSCTVTAGAVTVLGASGVAQQPATESAILAVLLSADATTPSIESIVGFSGDGSGRAPFAALSSTRPTRVRPLLSERANGDLLAWLRRNPDSARARLERYIVVEYAHPVVARQALNVWRAERHVQAAQIMPLPSFDTSHVRDPTAKSSSNQYHLDALAISSLRTLSGGWGLVGIADSGLDTEHPDLQSFVGSSYAGGNYLPALAYDHGHADRNPDERQPVIADTTAIAVGCALPASDPRCVANTPGAQCMIPAGAGHGTHVAGLVAANAQNADPLQIAGNCARCGIAEGKITVHSCFPLPAGGGEVGTRLDPSATPPALEKLITYGVQVVNLSFGDFAKKPELNYCDVFTGDAYCGSLKLAAESDVVVVSASGNDRNDINFPASDPRVIAVGGIDEALSFWDESPGSNASCPRGTSRECGSNYTLATNSRRQELVAPARNVRSTTYRGADWSSFGCGDSFGGGASNDGVGLCTGTSMSSPEVAGLVGVLRSINPLVRAGDPESSVVYGIRDVLVETTDRAVMGLGWNAREGYGRPNGERAASKMLGVVRGARPINRVTPLFTLYSSGNTDFASVATPQAAMALARANGSFYDAIPVPASAATPGYSAYPAAAGTSPPTPRANAYVLTTEFRSSAVYPVLQPLYFLGRECAGGSASCNEKDFLLLSSVPQMETLVAQGYGLRGIQGYVYARCANEPACIPPGAERLYLQCHASRADCAVFLERQRTEYQTAGYTAVAPGGTDPVLGYAYPNVDADGDSLVDGMEYVIGTNRNDADSDDDGVGDGVEYAQAGVPLSDPCAGPNVTCNVRPSFVYRNGFE